MAALAFALKPMLAQTVSRTGEETRSAQLKEAILAAQHGDGDRALQLTRALVLQHPHFEPALKFQASLLEDMGQGSAAASSYEAAFKLAPDDPELMLKVGTYRLVAGDVDQAISLFLRLSKQLPRDRDTLYYLAQAYHLKGDNELALKTILKCLKVDPENVSVWQKYGELLCSSGDNEASLRWLLKARGADPSLNRIYFDLGVASYKNQDLDNAVNYAAEAVQREPNDLKSLALLAAVEVKLAKWEQAKPVFERILAIQAEDPTSLLGLGHCELELKNYPAAADLLQRLLQQDPTQVLAHFYLSRTYAALGRTTDAEHEANLHSRMLEQASAIGPSAESEAENTTFTKARKLLEENDEAEALQVFRDHPIGPDASVGAPYMLVGVLYLYMGRPDRAQAPLEKSLALEPALRGARTYLGILALQQTDLDRAETAFKTELAAEPNDQLAVAELGEVRYRQGRWADAADQIAKSRTVEPRLLYMLSDAYFRLGKIKEADLTAELIVDYSKKNRDVLQGVLDLLNRNGQTALAEHLASKSAS